MKKGEWVHESIIMRGTKTENRFKVGESRGLFFRGKIGQCIIGGRPIISTFLKIRKVISMPGKFQQRSRHPYFQSIFMTITFFTAVIVLVLSAFLYLIFRSFSLNLLNSSNQKFMNQVFYNTMQINAYVKNYSDSLFSHPDTAQLMLAQQPLIADTLQSMSSLDTTLGTAPFLHSIYVYNGRTDTYYVVGPNPVIRHQEFYDSQIRSLFDQPDTILGPAPIPRKMPVSDNPDSGYVSVFSYVLAEKVADRSQIKNALVINVRMDWLFNTVESYGEADSIKGSNLLLLDRLGTVVADKDQKLFLTNIGSESYAREALASSSQSGVYMADVEGEKSVITFSSDPSSQWVLLNIMPYKYVAGTIDKIRNIILMIACSMLAFCFSAAFLLARRLHAPVLRLRDSVGQLLSLKPAAESRDEFDFISESVASVRNQVLSLSSFKKSNQAVLRQTLLREVLTASVPDQCEKAFREVQIGVEPHAALMLIMLRIDKYAQFCHSYSQRDRALLKYAVINIAEELLIQDYACACVDMGGDHIIAMINADGADVQPLDSRVRQLQQTVSAYCSFSVSAFISGSSNGIREARLLYEGLLPLSQYRLLYGRGCLLHAWDITEESSEIPRFDTLLQAMDESIRKGRLKDMEMHLQAIMEGLRRCSCSDISFTLSMLTASVFQTLRLIEKNSRSSFELDFGSFDQTIKACETLDEVEAEFYRIFRVIDERINLSKDDRISSLVNNAVRFIDEHYRDKALSTNMVADESGLTAAYLGKLFREQTSLSIAEYITEVRMNEAARLLRETRLTIDDLLEKIGWENKKHFFTLFRKRFGSTPTEYRLSQPPKSP